MSDNIFEVVLGYSGYLGLYIGLIIVFCKMQMILDLILQKTMFEDYVFMGILSALITFSIYSINSYHKNA